MPSQRDARPEWRPTAGGCHRRGLRSRWPADRGCAVAWPEPTCRALDAADPATGRATGGNQGWIGIRRAEPAASILQPSPSASIGGSRRAPAQATQRAEQLGKRRSGGRITGRPRHWDPRAARRSRSQDVAATVQRCDDPGTSRPRARAPGRHAWAAATVRMPVLPPSPSPGTETGQPLTMGPSRRARQRNRTRPATAQAAQPAGICLARASARLPTTTETGTGAGIPNRHSPNAPEGAGLQQPPEG